jgi:hypothetical protein
MMMLSGPAVTATSSHSSTSSTMADSAAAAAIGCESADCRESGDRDGVELAAGFFASGEHEVVCFDGAAAAAGPDDEDRRLPRCL